MKATLQYFMMAVTLIVVAVPEGLPMSVTLSLALNMRRMLSTNNLVRKMHACETMGAITVICTDKTGTLTQNLMQIYEPSFYGLKNGGEVGEDDISKLVIEGISTNSTAFLEEIAEGEKPKGVGNPTEVALLLWLNSRNRDYLELRENAPVVDQLTFSTERKFMATLVKSPLMGKKVLYVKGAPEIVLGKCKDVILDGKRVDAVEYRSTVENNCWVIRIWRCVLLVLLSRSWKIRIQGIVWNWLPIMICHSWVWLLSVILSVRMCLRQS